MRSAIACLALLTIAATSFAQSAPFEPPAGRVISGWGQFSSAWDLGQPTGKNDADDLAAYEKAVAPHPPAMISFDVGPDFTIVSGFLNRYRQFAATRGFFVAGVAINFRGLEHDVSIGMRDPDLLVLADGLREVGRPVLLRFGYEFNKPGALYEPSAFLGAFRHATDVMRKDHLNFATVWDATAGGFSDPQYKKWYPGDDVVDWWGLDLSDPRDFNRADSKVFVDDAARHHKPVLISAAMQGVKSEAAALKWYASFFDFISANPTIKAFSLDPGMRLARWPRVAAYVKKQLGDPRYVDAGEAPAIFRPSHDEQPYEQ
jgi:hypothetical protein